MNSLKLWATPLTVGAFFLLAITGVLMFFHWDTGLNKTAHEWLGWALVAGGLAHLTLHFASFKRHLQKPLGASIMGVFVLVLGLSFLSFGKDGGEGNPMKLAAEAVTKAPLVHVAPLAGQSPEALATRLAQNGFAVKDMTTETVATLAGPDRGAQMRVLKVVFAAAPGRAL